MEKIELPVHEHPLFLFDRVCIDRCKGCGVNDYFYGGYICNELACNTLFHKECVESAPEIIHPSHPNHPLKLNLKGEWICCSLCSGGLEVGYHCSVCNFNVHLVCARRLPSSTSSTSSPLPTTIDNSKVHQHPLLLSKKVKKLLVGREHNCKVCDRGIHINEQQLYECCMCNMLFHWECVGLIPDVYHAFHPKHPLKFLKHGAPWYADESCLLCGKNFKTRRHNYDQVYHCDVCNVTICEKYCMPTNPPPLSIMSLTTHEHQLNLVPRLLNFTCNACGTAGDRSPYFCLQCNFMIHRACIDLPRVININRHNHRISYTRHLGHGNWTCGVCRKRVDGFYGAYSCSKCPRYAVHARCATRNDVWDRVELEGTPEEEELAPFEVVDENQIKHFSHGHNLRLNKDGKSIHESKLCEACVSQINDDDSFYDCERCDFILHEKCASLPRKMRHVSNNIPFTLQTDTYRRRCSACYQYFSGFKYVVKSGHATLDVRCSSIFEPFLHESHPHPLYYKFFMFKGDSKCSACDRTHNAMKMLCCDECEFQLDFRCATLPRKVMSQRYDDHPLYLSYGENKEDAGQFWCEVCETKVDPKDWFYTCNPCGITLHVSSVVGDFSYHIPGPVSLDNISKGAVVPNTSICRPHCFRCSSRCKLPYILQVKDFYFCSKRCEDPREYCDQVYY